MTLAIANRFFGFLALLSIINADRRPKLVTINKADLTTQTNVFALFEDLKEAVFLMQYANGVRPYVLEWYYDVFIEAYNEKTVPDSKVVKKGKEDVEPVENRIAVTSEDLVEKQSKSLTNYILSEL